MMQVTELREEIHSFAIETEKPVLSDRIAPDNGISAQDRLVNVSKTEIKFSSTDADLRIFIEQDNGLKMSQIIF